MPLFDDNLDMEDFWYRVKLKLESENTTMDWVSHKIGVRADSFRRWSSRKTMPSADAAVKIAAALNTTTEFLVTGVEPFFLPSADMEFLSRARRWRQVVEDLEFISPVMSKYFSETIHALAESDKSCSTDTEQTPRAGNQ